jgi:hypothetical protein
MTRTPHDQFAKHCFEPLLAAFGEFTPSKKVKAEVREVDVYFEPSPSALLPAELGLLSRCIPRATLFEPFRNAASAHEIRACASKLYEVHNDIIRKAKRAKQTSPNPEQRPFLWIITPTMSEAVRNGFGAVQDVDWPPGVFLLPRIGIPVSLLFTNCPKLLTLCGFDYSVLVVFKLRLLLN